MGSFWARLDWAVKVRLPIVLGAVLIAVIVAGVLTQPVRRATGYAPVQPISTFSHQQHAGALRIDCRYCHTNVAKGRYAGIPSTSICMNCHKVAAIDSPGVARLRDFAKSNQPISWRRVHRLPDYVYFTHNVHIAAGVGCETCHGDVATMEVVRQVHPLTMGACIGCHRNPALHAIGVRPGLVGPENCSACHR